MHYTTMRPLALALTLAIGGISAAVAAPSVQQSGNRIVIEPGIEAPAYQVRLTGPDGLVVEMTRLDDEAIEFTAIAKSGWADGNYRYEIWPIIGVAKRDDHSAPLSVTPMAAVGGSFAVEDAQLYAASGVPLGERDLQTKDQIVPDDQIVQGSSCVGLDCVDGESFGVDTIRLKENNLRIKFDDTSSSAGFAANDWQLTANDQASGGQNKFSIEDITGAKVPFTILAGAATHSLYVDADGDIGLGTSTPVLDLHVTTNNTPALRFEQTNTGGFSAQTWDVAGNEANFFVRDVSGGSKLPFRIRPGAPTSSIDIAASGNVGIGMANATAKLHVSGNGIFTSGIDSTAIGATTPSTGAFTTLQTSDRLKVQSASQIFTFGASSVAATYGTFLKGGTSTPIAYLGSDGGGALSGGTGDNFVIRAESSLVSVAGGAERMRVLSTGNVGIGTSTPTEKLHVAGNIYASGNITITGSLSQGSDVNSKENFAAVDAGDVLDKLTSLDVTRWNYKVDGRAVQHIGPMAQDFYAAFGLGEAETKIAPLDTSGVTIVAVQELARRLQERDAELREREAEIAALRARLDRLDAQVAALARIAQPAATTVGNTTQAVTTTTGL